VFSYYLPWAIVIDQGRREFEKKEYREVIEWGPVDSGGPPAR